MNDVIEVQSDIKWLSKWTDDAGKQLKISMETGFLADVYSEVSAYNKGLTAGRRSSGYVMGAATAAVQITKTNALELLQDCASVLDEQDIPPDGRWIVLPTWYCNLLGKSDIKNVSITGEGESPMLNGRLPGTMAGFACYQSNLYTGVSDTWTCYHVLFGHVDAITFGAQLDKVQKIDDPFDYGQIVRGLMVYGYKTVNSAGVGELYCRK